MATGSPVPSFFNRGGSGPVVSFDFIEAISGSGYVEHQAIELLEGVSSAKKLITNTLRSQTIEAIYSITVGADYSLYTDSINYDSNVLSSAIIINGYVYAVFSWAMARAGAVNARWEGTITPKLYKWDGTTETLLATGSTRTFDTGSVGTSPSETISMNFEVGKVVLAPGEVIRLKITKTLQRINNGITTSETFYNISGQDPLNRDGTYLIPSSSTNQTKTQFFIPFKIIR